MQTILPASIKVSKTDCVKKGELIVYCLVFLILPPIIGLPIVIYQIWQKENASKTDYYKFFCCIALYFACINATKHPDGDQLQYYAAYMHVPQQGFIGSLINIYGITYAWQEVRTSISGEFMNGVYNYVGYYLTFGYYPLFAFIYTFVEYMLMFIGFYRFCQMLKKPHIPFVCGVLTLSFFYLFFQFTLHIQKQFFAQAIVMFVLGTYACTGKMSKGLWVMMVCAVFTHASTWLFVPFLVYKPLYGHLNRIGLLLLAVSFGVSIFYAPHMAQSLTGTGDENSVVGYGMNRLARSETHNDFQENVLVLSQILVIALPMALIILNRLWLNRKTEIQKGTIILNRLWLNRKTEIQKGAEFILRIVVLLLLTVVAMSRQYLAQYRYFMMLYAFMPYVYPFISNNIKQRDKILSVIALGMIVWFYYQFDKIIWHYAPEIDIVLKSPVWLIWGDYWG